MITTSTEINDLAAAMAKAQATIEGAIKDANNPHFKSKYADLSNVWAAWQKCGPANGLAVMQFPGECVDGRLHMTTLITHQSGQWVRSELSIPLSKVDAQGYGSATTYARRYALSAAVGIAPEDDDGNAASSPKGAANDSGKRTTARKISDDQLVKLEQLIPAAKLTPAQFNQTFGIERTSDLPADRFAEAETRLNDRLGELAKATSNKEAVNA